MPMENMNKKNQFNLQNSTFKWIVILGLNLIIAVALTCFLLFLLTYLGLIGEFATQGIAIIWQKIGTFLLPTIIIVLSVLVITLSNPVYALVCLILVFFSTALFLLSINVNFLALIYLIIYIGAIAILFLFVIMMFNLRELEKQSTELNDYSFISISFWFYLLLVSKFYSLFLDYVWTYIEYDSYFNEYFNFKTHSITYYLTYQYVDTLLFGTLLYTYYCYIFLVAALILLTAMLGSIILALSTTEKTIENI
jgi:NADH:ubiquinone oxidoreductase subunit 6 (subunit J)